MPTQACHFRTCHQRYVSTFKLRPYGNVVRTSLEVVCQVVDSRLEADMAELDRCCDFTCSSEHAAAEQLCILGWNTRYKHGGHEAYDLLVVW